MKLVQKRSKKTGLPPGTLVHIGERKPERVTVTMFRYSSTSCEEQQVEQLDRLSAPADDTVMWINVGGVHRVEVVETLGRQFSLHRCCSRMSQIRISVPNWTITKPIFSSSSKCCC
jgi:magnesium transporter